MLAIDRENVLRCFAELQAEAFACAKDKGFWDTMTDAEVVAASLTFAAETKAPLEIALTHAVLLARENTPRTLAEQIALQHSELSEVLEADRYGNPVSQKVPELSQIEEEYADLLIRVFDTAEKHTLRLGPAVLAKMAFNRTRPARHGKRY
jgi:NTP pyrophosphatase (non-canonical NTP hydrolase)